MKKLTTMMTLIAFVCGVMFTSCGGGGNSADAGCKKTNKEVNKLLDELEKLVDEQVALVNDMKSGKYKRGDQEPVKRGNELMQQIQEVGGKLDAFDESLITDKQKERAGKIMEKLNKM
jgi:hypothetical protein